MKKLQLLFLLLMTTCFIAACSKAPMSADKISVEKSNSVSAETERANNNIQTDERLGTKWGNEVSSNITQVDLDRVSDRPLDQQQIRYAAKQFKGQRVFEVPMASGDIRFSVRDDENKPLPIYRTGSSYFVQAEEGQRYSLKYKNKTNQLFEIVASVDGLDVITGAAASANAEGYVLRPHEELVIEGFRKSESAVAAFIFSQPEASYANHNSSGSIDNTGVIGTAIYQLEKPKSSKKQYAPEPTPQAFPADR
ncbi:hypothetical protein I2F62_09100 [Acinetobacter sp. MD2(2019)]|nr:hypothetical protein [Acinetobacter sp. MD2(2019)]